LLEVILKSIYVIYLVSVGFKLSEIS